MQTSISLNVCINFDQTHSRRAVFFLCAFMLLSAPEKHSHNDHQCFTSTLQFISFLSFSVSCFASFSPFSLIYHAIWFSNNNDSIECRQQLLILKCAIPKCKRLTNVYIYFIIHSNVFCST